MIWIELLILLACIVIGARLGGMALGTVAGIGLLIFVFVFGLPPGGPPQGVLGMIIAVITALATMLRSVRLELAEGQVIRQVARLTIRPRALRMTVRPRNRTESVSA